MARSNARSEIWSQPIGDRWHTAEFRRAIIAKLDEAINQTTIPVVRSGTEMENIVYAKVHTRDQYMCLIARLILHMREKIPKPENTEPQEVNTDANGNDEIIPER